MKNKLIQTQKHYLTSANFYQYAEFDVEGIETTRAKLQKMIEEYNIVGFRNCQNIVELKHQLSQLNYDKYRYKYPTYLFFDDDVFDKICKKNKLVVSTLETYTGYIPDYCFDAIKNENIDNEDIREDIYNIKFVSNTTRNGFSLARCNNEFIKSKFFCNIEDLYLISKETIEYFYCNNNIDNKIHTESFMLKHFYGKITRYSTSRNKKQDYLNREHTSFEVSIDKKEENGNLFIAAPKKHIDISKKTKKIFEVFKISKQKEVEDPIVFRKVKDGILVIEYWK